MSNQFSENNPLVPGGHKVSVRILAAIIFLVGAILLFELAAFVVVKFVVYPRDKASFFVP